jgi:hypothetical protein
MVDPRRSLCAADFPGELSPLVDDVLALTERARTAVLCSRVVTKIESIQGDQRIADELANDFIAALSARHREKP